MDGLPYFSHSYNNNLQNLNYFNLLFYFFNHIFSGCSKDNLISMFLSSPRHDGDGSSHDVHNSVSDDCEHRT